VEVQHKEGRIICSQPNNICLKTYPGGNQYWTIFIDYWFLQSSNSTKKLLSSTLGKYKEKKLLCLFTWDKIILENKSRAILHA
jgi:hypothetical protein